MTTGDNLPCYHPGTLETIMSITSVNILNILIREIQQSGNSYAEFPLLKRYAISPLQLYSLECLILLLYTQIDRLQVSMRVPYIAHSEKLYLRNAPKMYGIKIQKKQHPSICLEIPCLAMLFAILTHFIVFQQNLIAFTGFIGLAVI